MHACNCKKEDESISDKGIIIINGEAYKKCLLCNKYYKVDIEDDKGLENNVFYD